MVYLQNGAVIRGFCYQLSMALTEVEYTVNMLIILQLRAFYEITFCK